MSERWIKSVGKNVTLFAIGGFIYYMIEVVWRGIVHFLWSWLEGFAFCYVAL